MNESSWMQSLRQCAISKRPNSDPTQGEVIASSHAVLPGSAAAGTQQKSLFHSLQSTDRNAFAPSILANLALPGQIDDASGRHLDPVEPDAAEDARFDDILHGRELARREKHRSYNVIPRFYFGSVQSGAAKARHNALTPVQISQSELKSRRRASERDEVRLRLLRTWLRSSARARAVETRSAGIMEQSDLSDIVYILQELRAQVPLNPAAESAARNDSTGALPSFAQRSEPRIDYEAYCQLRDAAPAKGKSMITPELYMRFDRDHEGRISSRQLFQYLCAVVTAHRRALQLASLAAQSGEQAAGEAARLLRAEDEEAEVSDGGDSPGERPSALEAVQDAEAAAQGPPSLSEQDLELYLQDVAKEAPALARLPPPFVVFYVYTGVRRIVFMLQAEDIPGVGAGGEMESGGRISSRGVPEQGGSGGGVDGGPKQGDAVGRSVWRAARPSGRYSLPSVLACPAIAELGAIQRVTEEEASLRPASSPEEAAVLAAESSRADPLLAGVPGGATTLNWFSDRSALRVYGRYLSLDQDRDGLLSPDEMAGWGGGRLTQWFVKRLFATCRTYDGMMDYRTYLDVELALAPRGMGGLPGHPSAIKMLFLCLDADEKGYLDEHDVAGAFFHVQCRLAQAMQWTIVPQEERNRSKERESKGHSGFDAFPGLAPRMCTADEIKAGKVENILGTATFMAEFADMLGPWCVRAGSEVQSPRYGSTSKCSTSNAKPEAVRPPMSGVRPIRVTLPQLCRSTLGYSALRSLVDVDAFSSFEGKEAAASSAPEPTDAALVAQGAADGVRFGIMEPEEAHGGGGIP